MASIAGIELPTYKSHKIVWALEIETVDGKELTFKNKDYPSIICTSDMFSRYIPVSGDFYVIYEDGYQSFSPHKAFIEGYTEC